MFCEVNNGKPSLKPSQMCWVHYVRKEKKEKGRRPYSALLLESLPESHLNEYLPQGKSAE